MSKNYYYEYRIGDFIKPKVLKKKYAIHILLFVITFFTTTLAGVQWLMKDFTNPANWVYGLSYSIPLLLFLSAHEFGHYFAAKYHNVKATLPYYIPIFLPFFVNFGTFGAVIKTQSPIPNRKALFDIGVAGPIAGFIVSLGILIYGLYNLPPIDYIYSIHPEYLTQYNGAIPGNGLHFGDTLLYFILSELFANPNGFLPPMNEIYHYPFLCVGWFGLFVTALNLIPIGQLDGGHITYAMFGNQHRKIARSAWWLMFMMGLFSLLGGLETLLREDMNNTAFELMKLLIYPPLKFIRENLPWLYSSWEGWLIWAIITKFFIKLDHPPIYDSEELSPGRKKLGWIAILILISSFSYNGIYIIE